MTTMNDAATAIHHGPQLRLVGDSGTAGDEFVSAHAWLIGVVKSGRAAALSGRGFAVMTAYLAHADRDLTAWPRNDTLADMIGKSVATVRRGREELIELGLVDVLVQGGNDGRGTWRLRFRRALAADMNRRGSGGDNSARRGLQNCKGGVANLSPGGCKSATRRSPSKHPTEEIVDDGAQAMSDDDPPPSPAEPPDSADGDLFAERTAAEDLAAMGFSLTDARRQVDRYGLTVVRQAIAQVRHVASQGKRIRSKKGFLISTMSGIVDGTIRVEEAALKQLEADQRRRNTPDASKPSEGPQTDVEKVRERYQRCQGDHAARVRTVVATMRHHGWDRDRTCAAIDAMLKAERNLFEQRGDARQDITANITDRG